MRTRILSTFFAIFMACIPHIALACACGCGVFDIQTGSNMPNGKGGTVWLEYDYMNQHNNWNNTSSAPSANNEDKTIITHFVTVGGQYMFNNAWGVTAQLPYWDRYFKTTDEDTGDIVSFRHHAIGDARIKGIYSGFASDMSTGLTFGVKLPTGNYSYHGFDRDTQIGTGSTDILLGAYHMGWLDKARNWGWFVNGEWDAPVITTAGYRPGAELNVAPGIYYEKWNIGDVAITPIAQLIGAYRLSDRGPNADAGNSGYTRVLFSPGIEISKGKNRLFTSISAPLYDDVKGNQLTAPVLFKVKLSRDF